jgi:putative transcriptional regulator
MKHFSRILRFLAALMVLFAGLAGAAPAVDLSHAVLLVASDSPSDSVYEQTVVLAAPLPEGGHLGIIINRPTSVKLESLFPEQASTHNVVDPVYMGGPMLSNVLFALTAKAPEGASKTITLMPGLVAVLDADSVDHIIDTTPNDARYFLGFTLWKPDALAAEIDSGAWTVQPADASSVLQAKADGMWKQLGGNWI